MSLGKCRRFALVSLTPHDLRISRDHLPLMCHGVHQEHVDLCRSVVRVSLLVLLTSLGCVALSGLFSATFPLTFAYIADCVPPNERAPAYGLALATLGLSFTIGPPLGGYIDSNFGSRSVFILSFALILVNIVYILFILPETVQENVLLSFLPSFLLPSLLSLGKAIISTEIDCSS